MMAPLFLVLLAASPVFAVPEDKDLVQYRDYENTDRIIGGISSTIQEFPFIVALLYSSKYENESEVTHGCGGTIVTEDWVLTAAHCVDLSRVVPIGMQVLKQLTEVRAGSSFRDRGGIVRRVIKTVNQPFHDIALIKVDEPWPLTETAISLARLPRQDDPIPVGSLATIMGWGATDLQKTHPEVLMKSEVMVISPAYCNAIVQFWTRDFINDKQMCTLFHPLKMPSVTWKGDSGSPVVANGEVVGVASLSHPHYVLPNVHTRVSCYIDWIEENVGPLPSTKS